MFSGLILGLSGGLSPGPLLTLVISETLRHGVKEGIKIALAPLLTDLPIVAAAILVLSRLSDMQPIIGGIYLLGGGFLAYLAYESLCFKGADLEIGKVKPQSFKKGIIANFLNPSPYLFWISIGAPTVLKASESSITAASVFILSFYVLLVGSKVGVAVIAGKSRVFLKSDHYIYTMRGLGLILLIFALVFFRDGLRQF